MEKIYQKYTVEVLMYPTFKLVNERCYLFKFKVNIETDTYSVLEAIIHLDGQKTLSSYKPRQIYVTSHLASEDGGPISKGDRFTIYDIDGKLVKDRQCQGGGLHPPQ